MMTSELQVAIFTKSSASHFKLNATKMVGTFGDSGNHRSSLNIYADFRLSKDHPYLDTIRIDFDAFVLFKNLPSARTNKC